MYLSSSGKIYDKQIKKNANKEKDILQTKQIRV